MTIRIPIKQRSISIESILSSPATNHRGVSQLTQLGVMVASGFSSIQGKLQSLSFHSFSRHLFDDVHLPSSFLGQKRFDVGIFMGDVIMILGP